MTKALFNISSFLIIITLIACSPKNKMVTKTKGIQFENSVYIDDILALAKKENKLVFIDLYTDWCEPCKLMDKDVFTDKEIAKIFNANFINYKVDGESEKGKNLAFMFQLTMYPTLLFLDSDGNMVARNDGALYHTEFKAFANQVLDLNAL